MEPAAAAAAPHSLDFVALFLQADYVVKLVMIVLALASLACWTVIVDKLVRVRRALSDARRFEVPQPGRPSRAGGAGARIAEAGRAAALDLDPSETRAERRERIERAMRIVLGQESRRLQAGLPILATTGAAAPFVGLFGTVWGIMNSFSAIAQSQDTSLAVVAPGIAEALFATAIGLVAAIPAVVFYNKITTDLSRVQQAGNAGIARLGDILARPAGTRLRSEAAE
jgi:biopolymer transport protein TolQ